LGSITLIRHFHTLFIILFYHLKPSFIILSYFEQKERFSSRNHVLL